MKARVTKVKRRAGHPVRGRRQNTTRVTVDFPKDQHRRLKAKAALAGVSLQEYIRVRVVVEEENISDDELDPIVKKIIKENRAALKRLADK